MCRLLPHSCRGRPVLANCLVRFRALAVSILLISAFAVPAFAGPFEDAIGKFATDEFSDTEEAIGVVATSGNPNAFAIISALQDGRLAADPDTKQVFVTQPDGKIIDAATAAAVDKLPDGAAAVRLNNRLRRVVEAALGGLTLLSPDPVKRVQAAQSVFKTHDEAMLPVVDGALAKETNKAAKLGVYRGARGDPAVQARRHRCREAGGHRHHQGARRPGSAGPADRIERRSVAGDRQRGGRRHRGDPAHAGAVVHRAKCLVRPVARLGAAARRHWPRHHLRRDGRHQHGPWRDGDDRRLCHLRGAGGRSGRVIPACSTIRC